MLAASIRGAARRFGERAMLVDAGGRPWSYAEVDRRSDAVAAGMVAGGVGAGDVVALTLPSVPQYVVAYVAAAKRGAVTAGINPRLSDAERSPLLAMVEPRLVLAGAHEVDALAVDGEAPPELPSDPDRPAAVVFTSGTTGSPRAAVFDERRIEAIGALELGPDVWDGGRSMLASTEFCHVGITTKLAWYARAGMTLVLTERWRADDALRLAAEHGMPALGGVPPQFALMLRSPLFEEVDLSAVRTVTLGAGPASPGLRRDVIDRFGAQLSVRYSSTESGGCGTATAFDAPDEEALFTEGRPRGPIEIAVRDGEVCLRTPTAMVGYWRDPAATAEVFHADGFLRMGDLGEIDEAGCLRLVGRAKEMYVRGGYNVFPVEVEAALSRHDGVAEVAVVPRPDDVMGEVGVAVVVPADPARPPTLDELRAYASGSLAAYKLPEDLRLVPALPLTPMHKVDRRRLADSMR